MELKPLQELSLVVNMDSGDLKISFPTTANIREVLYSLQHSTKYVLEVEDFLVKKKEKEEEEKKKESEGEEDDDEEEEEEEE